MTQPSQWPSLKRPLVAILRGVKPSESLPLIETLLKEGFEAIEVPLNSPSPLATIEMIVKEFGEQALLGAGTVLDPQDCHRLADIGAKLVVTPNTDTEVISTAVQRGLVTMPGVFTPTEALQACKAGASALKFFPASVLSVSGINAIRAVLPSDMPVGAVGGISEHSFEHYIDNGITIFGMSSTLYRPGDSVKDIAPRAQTIIRAYDEALHKRQATKSE